MAIRLRSSSSVCRQYVASTLSATDSSARSRVRTLNGTSEHWDQMSCSRSTYFAETPILTGFLKISQDCGRTRKPTAYFNHAASFLFFRSQLEIANHHATEEIPAGVGLVQKRRPPKGQVPTTRTNEKLAVRGFGRSGRQMPFGECCVNGW